MFIRIFMVCMLLLLSSATGGEAEMDKTSDSGMIKLPEPDRYGKGTVNQAIQQRRSVRDFKQDPITLQTVSDLLWAAGGMTVDGVTGPTRAYPSAGAIYPLELYLVAGNVTGIDPGVYRYNWKDNALVPVKEGDVRAALADAAMGQGMIRSAPVTLVVVAEYGKINMRYGKRGMTRYVHMEAGHIGQNIHLISAAMGLGTVMIGAFSDDEVAKVLDIDVEREVPVYMMPVGIEREVKR